MDQVQTVESHGTMVTVVLYTVYTQMVQAFTSTAEARQYIARMTRHFTLAEIYTNGTLVDSLHLASLECPQAL